MSDLIKTTPLHPLRATFGERLQKDVPLARYTSARVGGPADWLLVANTANDLADMGTLLWKLDYPFRVIGSGANVLVSDEGVRGVVIINRARDVHFHPQADYPSVWAESGVNLGALARQCAAMGLSGLEWAVGVPGTVGGAVVGNAGAHGGEMANNLLMAEILQHDASGTQRERTTSGHLGFGYRTSMFKQNPGQKVVLSALLRLENSSPEAVQQKVNEFNEKRHLTQPPGASMGSMFKNPSGDFAGRLIESVGLKGARIQDAEISSKHANFFINRGNAKAADVYRLIEMARRTVRENTGIELELEVELMGDWPRA